jgi:hypothetical protein
VEGIAIAKLIMLAIAKLIMLAIADPFRRGR